MIILWLCIGLFMLAFISGYSFGCAADRNLEGVWFPVALLSGLTMVGSSVILFATLSKVVIRLLLP